MYEYLDRRYALALYKVAKEKNKIDEYFNDLKEICNLIESNKDFYDVIKHPQISTKKKKQTFKNIFKNRIDDDLLSFLLILIEKERILFLKEKLTQMEYIYLEERNTLIATVKSAIPLLDEELEQLKINLEKKFKKSIVISTEIDKSLLGGVYVRVGNYVIDGTVKSKINEMKSRMLKKD